MTVFNVRKQFIDYCGKEKDVEFDSCFNKENYSYQEIKQNLENKFPELDVISEMLEHVSYDEYSSICFDKDIINMNIPMINIKRINGVELYSYGYFAELRKMLLDNNDDKYRLSFLLDSVFRFFINKHNESVDRYNDLYSFIDKAGNISRFSCFNSKQPEKKEKTKYSGFVYIASCGIPNAYKIGKANDITKREKTFVTGNHLLKIFAYTQSQNPLQLESLLHSIYGNKNISGEWFELTKEELDDLVGSFCFTLAIEDEGKK